jgi:aminoglycoside 6'-N-acetyltransferase I
MARTICAHADPVLCHPVLCHPAVRQRWLRHGKALRRSLGVCSDPRQGRSMSDLVVRLVGREDLGMFQGVAGDVFDGPIDAALLSEFIADPRHHLAVALSAANEVVGFASAVHYVHPDERPQLFINEVGVAEPWQGRGLGSRLLRALLDHAQSLGCTEAWALTDAENAAACALYRAAGGLAQSTVMFTLPVGERSSAPASENR